MEMVRADEAKPRKSTASVARAIAESLGIDGFALNYYELSPGDTFSTNLHTHLDQEEIFYVLDGTATFETDDGQVRVGSGEVVRFEPGEYHHGYNDTDERLVGLAFGAPKRSERGRIECPACGERASPEISWTGGREAIVFECGECGHEINRQT